MKGRAGVLREIGTLFGAGSLGSRTDAELVDRYLSGGPKVADAAFAALVERHGPMVVATCRRILRDEHAAQDAFQATFLVLARKAGRVGRRDRLAGWLHGVASRTAMKARATAARRTRHERARAESIPEGRRPFEDALELRAALHEEIARLPEKYREPVVLCHLEGMTRERASAQLGCPEGTVGVRLLRARERLRVALARRGFAVATGALAVVLGDEASAALPAALVAPTTAAARDFVVGRMPEAGTAPARAVGLARGVLKAMSTQRLLVIAPALILVGGVAAGARALVTRPPAAPRGEPSPRMLAADSSRWKKALTGGGSVELLRISPHGGAAGEGWSPDGPPADVPPPYQTPFPLERFRPFVFEVRATCPPADGDFSLAFDFPGQSGSASDSTGDGPPTKVYRAIASLSERALTGTVRVGVASGDWKTEGTSDGEARRLVDTPLGSILFTKARATPDGLRIAVADEFADRNVRVLAIGRDGRGYPSSDERADLTGLLRARDFRFRLALEDLREFRLQARDYEWVEFRGVPLARRAAPGP